MGKNCFDGIAHESLDSCPNDEIAGGTSTRLFYAPVEFFTKVTLPAGTGTYAERITIVNDGIAFKDGKGWKGIDVMVDENELKSVLAGNRGNKKSKAEMDFFIPGFSAKNVGFMDLYKNCPMVFAVFDANGTIWILGTLLNPAYLESGDGTTGKKFDDNSGFTVKISANAKLYKYAGNIAEKD